MTDNTRPTAQPRDESPTHTRISETQARLVIESVRDYAIFMVDAQGHVATWNPGAEAIKGYRADEIIGQSISRFYPPEDLRQGKPEKLLRAAAENGRVEDEGWRVRKDGRRFWADVVISAVRDASGELIGYSKVTRDLTERRNTDEQLRLSEERFRLLVEGVKDYAIFMLDPTGRVMTWNVGAERLKGYRASEIIGQRITRFYTEEDLRSGKCEFELETALREGRFEEEGWRIRKDGSRFWANVVLTAIFDAAGHHIGFAKVTRDLTERKRMEEERLRLVQAQEALRLRDEFLSIASHELKTPITALQLQLHSLREQLATHSPKILTKVDRATRSSERMAALIESLLDVSRISTGRFEMNPQRLDLSELVHEVSERLRDSATRAGCELTIHAGGAVLGTWDRLRLEQVLTNLLSNAIRYAARSPISVSLVQEGESAVLEVCDKGPGIPEDSLSRIFERFERAAERSNHGGLGLGLYVVREIVHAHGGMATVRNAPGGGACFTIRLPLLPRVATREEPTKAGEMH